MTRDHARKLMTQIRLTGNSAYERYMEASETPLDRAFNSLYRAFDELQSVVGALVEQMTEEPRRVGGDPEPFSPVAPR